jgi:4-hydroxymandelate oxidase
VKPVCLADFDALARAQLDDRAWAYFSGGAADEITQRENRAAWDALRLLPRVLQPLQQTGPGIELLGRHWPHPVLMAPMAYQQLAHPDGEAAAALACAAQGAGYVLSTQASQRLEDVAALVRDEPGRGPLWFQLYPQADRALTHELMQRAQAAGFEAIVLTVDAPVTGVRDRERRAGFGLPPGVRAVNLPPAADSAESAGAAASDWRTAAPTWADVQGLLASAPLPLLIKGVLHPEDARQAARLGVAGLIVSNHGGRTLDTAVATALALPRIADALQGDLPLLVDGGIRRGTDVLKALALGASAVLVGRPLLMALAAGGAQGVALALRLLQDELLMALALTGCAAPAAATRRLLV